MYTVKTKYGDLKMPLNMENDILNKHHGKTALVIANGPSTKRFLNDIMVLAKQKDKYCVFVCGTADELFANIGIDMFKEIQPDFWVVANSIQRVDNYYEKFNRLNECNGILAFAIGVDTTVKLENLLKIKYHCYNRGIESVSENDVPLIQSYVRKYTNFDKMYSGGHTVAVHMVALAILSGCKTIKICGVDLDYKLGYFDNYTKNPDSFGHWKHDILMDFKTLSDSAKNIGVEIINLAENSPLASVLKTFPSLT